MSYASILVHVRADDEGAARLNIARDLAGELDATLIGFAAQGISPAPFSDPYGAMTGDWIGLMREQIETGLKDARTAFKGATANVAKKPLLYCEMALPAPALARAARAADLLVIGMARGSSDPYTLPSPGELAVTAGRPVLVVPANAQSLSLKRVMVAWKDTREARRAVADALPLLKRAEDVLVVEICTPDQVEDAKIRTDDVVGALVRHGVAARAEVVPHLTADAHEILHKASLFGANLIVLGAYGHSRLGEWVFGGVTRDLLNQDDRFLLLSH